MSSGMSLAFVKRRKCFSISIRLLEEEVVVPVFCPDANGSAGLSDAKSISTDSDVAMYGSLFCLCSLYKDSFMWSTSDVPHVGGAVRRRRQWRLQYWLQHGSSSSWSWREVAPYRFTGRDFDTETVSSMTRKMMRQSLWSRLPTILCRRSQKRSHKRVLEQSVLFVKSQVVEDRADVDQIISHAWQELLSERIVEDRDDVLTFQVDEMNQVTSPDYIFERQRGGVSMSQSFEEIVELVSQKRRQKRMEQQIVDVPVARNIIVETVLLASQESRGGVADEFGFGRGRVTLRSPSPNSTPLLEKKKEKKKKKGEKKKKKRTSGGERGRGAGGPN